MSQSWILVGMMGAGKTSVGRRLAELANREFLDTDRLLQTRLGRPIPQIFSLYGEAAFRDHETAIIRSLTPGASVVSTGGGVILREENRALLKALGTTVYLKSSAANIKARLQASKKKRPLLDRDDWEKTFDEILASREPIYAQSDHIVDVDSMEVEDAADFLLKLLTQESGS